MTQNHVGLFASFPLCEKLQWAQKMIDDRYGFKLTNIENKLVDIRSEIQSLNHELKELYKLIHAINREQGDKPNKKTERPWLFLIFLVVLAHVIHSW